MILYSACTPDTVRVCQHYHTSARTFEIARIFDQWQLVMLDRILIGPFSKTDQSKFGFAEYMLSRSTECPPHVALTLPHSPTHSTTHSKSHVHTYTLTMLNPNCIFALLGSIAMVTCTQNSKPPSVYDGYIEKDDQMIVYRPDRFHTGNPKEFRIVAKSEEEAKDGRFNSMTVIQCCTYRHHGSVKTTLAVAVHKEHPLDGINFLDGKAIKHGACQQTECTPMMVETMEWRLQVLAGLLNKESTVEELDPMDKEQLKLFRSEDLKERFMVASLEVDQRSSTPVIFLLQSLLLHGPPAGGGHIEKLSNLHSLLHYWILKLNLATERHYIDRQVEVDVKQLITLKYETRHTVILYRPDKERNSGLHNFRMVFASMQELGTYFDTLHAKIINCGILSGTNVMVVVAVDKVSDKNEKFKPLKSFQCASRQISLEAWRMMEKRINTLQLMRMALIKPDSFDANGKTTLYVSKKRHEFPGKNRNGMYAQLWFSYLSSSRPHNYLDRFRYSVLIGETFDFEWKDGYILDMDLQGKRPDDAFIMFKNRSEAEFKERFEQINTEYDRIVSDLKLDNIEANVRKL